MNMTATAEVLPYQLISFMTLLLHLGGGMPSRHFVNSSRPYDHLMQLASLLTNEPNLRRTLGRHRIEPYKNFVKNVQLLSMQSRN